MHCHMEQDRESESRTGHTVDAVVGDAYCENSGEKNASAVWLQRLYKAAGVQMTEGLIATQCPKQHLP